MHGLIIQRSTIVVVVVKNRKKKGSSREGHIIGLIKHLIRSSIYTIYVLYRNYLRNIERFFSPLCTCTGILLYRINWSCRVTRTACRRGKQYDTLLKIEIKTPFPTEVCSLYNVKRRTQVQIK